MNEALKDFIEKFVIVYIDDILSFSQSKVEHLRHLRLVLGILQQEKILINLKKCSLMKTKLVFLGFVISQEGMKMDLEKVNETMEWTCTRSIYEVRSFHGLARFYGKFIKNFNSICAPIVETIKGEHQPFEWTKEAEKGFRLSK